MRDRHAASHPGRAEARDEEAPDQPRRPRARGGGAGSARPREQRLLARRRSAAPAPRRAPGYVREVHTALTSERGFGCFRSRALPESRPGRRTRGTPSHVLATHPDAPARRRVPASVGSGRLRCRWPRSADPAHGLGRVELPGAAERRTRGEAHNPISQGRTRDALRASLRGAASGGQDQERGSGKSTCGRRGSERCALAILRRQGVALRTCSGFRLGPSGRIGVSLLPRSGDRAGQEAAFRQRQGRAGFIQHGIPYIGAAGLEGNFASPSRRRREPSMRAIDVTPDITLAESARAAHHRARRRPSRQQRSIDSHHAPTAINHVQRRRNASEQAREDVAARREAGSIPRGRARPEPAVFSSTTGADDEDGSAARRTRAASDVAPRFWDGHWREPTHAGPRACVLGEPMAPDDSSSMGPVKRRTPSQPTPRDLPRTDPRAGRDRQPWRVCRPTRSAAGAPVGEIERAGARPHVSFRLYLPPST